MITKLLKSFFGTTNVIYNPDLRQFILISQVA
jgi:hypothetical protein